MQDDAEIKALLLLNACYQRLAMDQATLKRVLTEEEKHTAYREVCTDVRRFADNWPRTRDGRAYRN